MAALTFGDNGTADPGSRAQRIKDEVADTRIGVAGIDAAIQTLRAALERNRKMMPQLQKEKAIREDHYSQLIDDYETAQSNYGSLSKKYQEIPLAVGSRSIELTAIAPAIPPIKPYKPWIALNMILGGLLGFLVSLPLSLLVYRLESPAQTRQGQEVVSTDRQHP